jgi:hypothetical protein
MWRTRFGRGYGPVVRQTTEWMNEWMFQLYSFMTLFITNELLSV